MAAQGVSAFFISLLVSLSVRIVCFIVTGCRLFTMVT